MLSFIIRLLTSIKNEIGNIQINIEIKTLYVFIFLFKPGNWQLVWV